MGKLAQTLPINVCLLCTKWICRWCECYCVSTGIYVRLGRMSLNLW